ncbi:MAG: Fic family protein [Planctomycetota bacterium]
MKYTPRYTVTGRLLKTLEDITALKTKIESASVSVAWIPAIRKDSFLRTSHSSTAIEGNPLTLKEVKILSEGGKLPQARSKHIYEVLNYFAALRFIEQRSAAKVISEKDLLRLHTIIGQKALEREPVGAYRPYQVYVGNHIPPPATSVPGLMKGLLDWLNYEGPELPAVLSSAILHYRFEHIHPFGDGNGRMGRTLATWELYRKKFDTYHIFAVDEIFWENRPAYYEALDAVRRQKEDLTGWLEFVAGAIEKTLDLVWRRILLIGKHRKTKPIVFSPKQEKLLTILQYSPLSINEIQKELKSTKQGAHFILNPLMDNKLVKRIGGHKTGKYTII